MRWLGRVLLVVGYSLLVGYDVRVWMVVPSAWRYLRLPVDPSILTLVPPPVPLDADELAAYVERLVPWAKDAEVYGVPWYFPTPREVVRDRRGDCEAQAIVLASLLAARGIPYEFRASSAHLWVEFPTKRPRQGELAAEALMQNVDGHYRFRWPALPEWRDNWDAQVDLLWTPLHPVRKILLLVGWLVLPWWPPRRRRRRMLETRTGGERVYSGRVINLDLDQIRLADGRESVREVIRHPGAVLIVPLLADGRVVLIRQHRYTAGRELWELPAGGLNPDDPDHLAAAQRELAEETGYRADHWQPLTHFFTTPGFTDEVIYCFLATGLTADAVAEGDEDEAIEVVLKPLAEALDMVRDGTIEDAKTMVALLLAADQAGRPAPV